MLKRQEIIDRLADKGYSKRKAGEFLDRFTDVITEALIEGEEVMLHGFGTFCVRETPARNSFDVSTGGSIVIKGRKVPKFMAGEALKRSINEGALYNSRTMRGNTAAANTSSPRPSVSGGIRLNMDVSGNDAFEIPIVLRFHTQTPRGTIAQ